MVKMDVEHRIALDAFWGEFLSTLWPVLPESIVNFMNVRELPTNLDEKGIVPSKYKKAIPNNLQEAALEWHKNLKNTTVKERVAPLFK